MQSHTESGTQILGERKILGYLELTSRTSEK